jgi:hypothetical protein
MPRSSRAAVVPIRSRQKPSKRRSQLPATETAGPDREAVETAAEGWTDAVLACRTYGHQWRPLKAQHSPAYRYIRTEHVCRSCRAHRVQEMSERGSVYATWYVYPDGYLLRGSGGRITGDARDGLRLAAVGRIFRMSELPATETETRQAANRRDGRSGA